MKLHSVYAPCGSCPAGGLFEKYDFNGILIPRQFLSGGFTGLALIIHYLSPAFPLGAIYLVLNIPNYAFGWKYVGRRFFLYSIAGMFIFSAAIEVVHISLPVYDYLLSALLAGVLVGTGSGFILKSLGSAGGTDILSVILLKLFSVRLGTTIPAFNGIILAAGVFGVRRRELDSGLRRNDGKAMFTSIDKIFSLSSWRFCGESSA